MWELLKKAGASIVFLAVATGYATLTCAADPPADTQPAPRNSAPNGLIDPVGIVQRLENQIAQLDLSPEQRAHLDEFLAKAMQDAQALEGQVRSLRPGQRMQRLQPFIANLRQHLVELLEPRQLQMLRQRATTRPIGGGVVPTPPGAQMQRLRQALAQIDLTPEEKQKVDDALMVAQQKLQQFRQNQGAGNGSAPEIVADARQQLRGILNRDQVQKLRQLMPAAAAEDGPNRPDLTPPARHDATAEQSGQHPASRKSNPTTHPTVGMDAPAFQLNSLGGATIDLAKLHGRVVIMEFGSFTSPTFRAHVAAMEKLYQQYGSRASFFVVYTREAHPSDAAADAPAPDPSDPANVTQPTEYADRRALAEKTRTALHVTIPMLIDSMDDAVTDSYGGYPNATIVIGKDGKIAGRQQWNDPTGLGRILDAALAAEQ